MPSQRVAVPQSIETFKGWALTPTASVTKISNSVQVRIVPPLNSFSFIEDQQRLASPSLDGPGTPPVAVRHVRRSKGHETQRLRILSLPCRAVFRAPLQ